MSIVPLSFNRTSVALQTNRAYNNLSGAQILLSRYEEQLLSGQQYRYGSDAPYNASASLSVQTLIERKTQNVANIKSTQTFLSATDSTLSLFNALTDDARAMALEAINTTTSSIQRTALAQTVKQTVQQIFDFSNYSFENRYVFSGSTTSVLPFEWGKDSYTIKYNGTESNIYSWSDTDLLSQSNVNGVEVFGAISDPVRGKADLNPAVRDTTLLSNLNGGNGVEKGSIRFNYKLNDQIINMDIDLSRCVTLDDVKRTIENSKSPYFSVKVDLTSNGLSFSLPEGTIGSVTVTEVGKGTVARQLGIPTGIELTSQKQLIGRDLNPALTQTTLLDDILGSRAGTTLVFAGTNNNIVLRANHNGNSIFDAKTGNEIFPLNDVRIAFRADPLIVPGEEWAEYDNETKTILVNIHPDNTISNNIIRAINDAAAAGTIPPFTASVSGADQQNSDLAGTGTVTLLPGITVIEGITGGGTGIDFDPSGIQLVNGDQTFNISFENCKTVGDLLAELNDSQYGLYVSINENRNGIDIRSRISGTDFCIGENGGTTATQFGIRTTDFESRLTEFDFGRGVTDYDGPGIAASAHHNNVTPNSSLILTARNEGKTWNDYTVNFVPTTDPQGKVIVSMDETAKIINIGINPGVTTACEVVDAFNAQPGPKQYFNLELDTTNGTNTGEGVVYDGFVTTNGGIDGGIDFTITRNDGTILEIDIHGAKTLGDVLQIINDHPDNRDGLLSASLSKFGNGIELTDKSFGEKVTRVDRTLLSTTAIELGLINMGEEYRTKTEIGSQAGVSVFPEVLNGSILVTAKSVGTYANDVQFEVIEGTPPNFVYDATSKTLRFSVEPGVTTANDLINLFQNQASATVRSMFDIQNGINPDGLPSNGSGLVTLNSVTMTGGTDSVLKGNDPNPLETDSLFNALIRLQVAMEKNDTREIERATQLLDTAVERLDGSRASIGVMQNSLDNVQLRLSEENIQYETTLNSTLRIDFADASLNYMAQQLAYQASMQVTSAMLQMSLLNYL
ncbi:MAG: hypothetical protein LBI18_09160 [Planctomycetaceae bacterium]|jgi:flagellin-like hook-associated protein FlgL|nr:hypothetical protein [Planctomycetaceae bacterium]